MKTKSKMGNLISSFCSVNFKAKRLLQYRNETKPVGSIQMQSLPLHEIDPMQVRKREKIVINQSF